MSKYIYCLRSKGRNRIDVVACEAKCKKKCKEYSVATATHNLTDKEFEELQNTIHQRIIELAELQGMYSKETGRNYVISGPAKIETIGRR